MRFLGIPAMRFLDTWVFPPMVSTLNRKHNYWTHCEGKKYSVSLFPISCFTCSSLSCLQILPGTICKHWDGSLPLQRVTLQFQHSLIECHSSFPTTRDTTVNTPVPQKLVNHIKRMCGLPATDRLRHGSWTYHNSPSHMFTCSASYHHMNVMVICSLTGSGYTLLFCPLENCPWE